jgi:hypothetical protein
MLTLGTKHSETFQLVEISYKSKNSCSHEIAKLVKLGSVMSMIVVLLSCWE